MFARLSQLLFGVDWNDSSLLSKVRRSVVSSSSGEIFGVLYRFEIRSVVYPSITLSDQL